MMRRRMRHTTQKSQHTERWLVSYADYMTIMFAFFVVMYAIAISKNEDFQILSDSLEQVFEKSARKQEQAGTGVNGTGILTDRVTPENDILYGESIRKDEQGPELLDGQSETSNIDKKHLGKPLDSLLTKLQSALIDEIRDGEASLELHQDWLIIELSSGMLFSSGSAVAQQRAKEVVALVKEIIAPVDNYIRVRGYTDNEGIRNEMFRSNWELSVARATSILVELESLGINPARMAIEGYGQYSPFASNDTAQGRAENRKVVVALSKYGLPPEPKQNNDQPMDVAPEEPAEIELPSNDNTIKVIQLPHGGIRITTRNEQ
ncbi:chemotaxis protein [Pseudoalteromonas lipolytica]|jgi:chemotaxis protein MotB|uniref:Chemotaxis protein n=3 Tax=Pseudoalteromonas lipolytica TaxID=570156 RepID=A0AAD0WBV0_9GAMM|nr:MULTISPECIES: flagellar motor protein MotB [Pseudoalteromonas]AXV64659.1 chemotaxis protein [Pseudoalteromonas donghaensis]MAE02144.1 chemotaxis protein [Pseudoalteromonas sp.]MCC9661858.1 OmpA family protein [Pseudoalteromonas sp. MB41]QLJ09146.1 OmpA family protein [Pseudoalteromonas sp. JSTW]QMW15374.1 OmpA family protein [Pseudoalteromonas sp. MT33b]|tara:strand:- start:1281 stop:2240 length:960 start_codon:yes stop_codon:yes gene_type:complete